LEPFIRFDIFTCIGVNNLNIYKSNAIEGKILGLCTLTATSLPFNNVALYTCPIDAAAIGSFEKVRKRSLK
jgi:hypothetical protein